jgi:sugar phosphate isomerase/epimerase
MRVGISTHIFAWHELSETMLEDIAAAGFKSIELWCSRQHLGYHRPGRVKKVLERISDNGLELASVHAPFYYSVEEARAGRFLTLSSPEPQVRETAFNEIEMVIGDLSIEDPIPMVLHTGLTYSDGNPAIEENFLDGLEKLLPLCRKAGLKVALENGSKPGAGCAKMMELVRRSGSLDVGVCLDTGHGNILSSPLQELSICATRLMNMHVHDNDGAGDRHRPPFGGNIPWEQFMAALKDTGYGGPFILETAGNSDPHLCLQETARAMEKLGFPWISS